MKLQKYIAILEKEIRSQRHVLENLIDIKNWNLANNQEKYVAGLVRAHHLAMATFVVNSREDGQQPPKEVAWP